MIFNFAVLYFYYIKISTRLEAHFIHTQTFPPKSQKSVTFVTFEFSTSDPTCLKFALEKSLKNPYTACISRVLNPNVPPCVGESGYPPLRICRRIPACGRQAAAPI